MCLLASHKSISEELLRGVDVVPLLSVTTDKPLPQGDGGFCSHLDRYTGLVFPIISVL